MKFKYCPTRTITAVLNEKNEVLLLRQDYVTQDSWVLVAGYMKKGENAEDSAIREVLEETGQTAESIEFAKSYYYEKKELLMLGTHLKKPKAWCVKEVSRTSFWAKRKILYCHMRSMQ